MRIDIIAAIAAIAEKKTQFSDRSDCDRWPVSIWSIADQEKNVREDLGLEISFALY